MINKNKLFLFIVFSILLPAFFFLLSNINYVSGMEGKKQNVTLAFDEYNFIAADDWYCNGEIEKTIQNILSVEPEVIITTRDHVIDFPSTSYCINMSKPLKDITRIAAGNHDAEFANIYKQIVDYHNIKSPYYSHDFESIHFISMSTEHPFEKSHNQYYEMTYPLLYNGEYEKIINKKIKPQPIVGEFHTNEGNIIDHFRLGET